MSFLFISESQALQELAAAVPGIAHPAVLARLKSQSATVTQAANSTLWDNITGLYRQLDASPDSRGFSSAISPTSFYGMIASVPSIEQAERMVKNHLTNSSEFCVSPGAEFATPGDETCQFALPSISRSDPNFYDNNYWRGRIWGPTNLLTWIGLSNPAYSSSPRIAAARRGLCNQSLNLLLLEWKEHRHVHENYNSTLGIGGDVTSSNPFYHWGANLGYMAMREAMDGSTL